MAITEFFWNRGGYIFPEEVRFLLHGSGEISPSSVHTLATAGFFVEGLKLSNIMPGKDPEGQACLIMYISGMEQLIDYTTNGLTHYSGYVITPGSEINIHSAGGATGLHKYYSRDGAYWSRWPDPGSPQSFFLEDGSEPFYESNHIKLTPILYTDEFGSVFGYKDPEGPSGPSGP